MGKYDHLLVRASSCYKIMTHADKTTIQKGHITYAQDLEKEHFFGFQDVITVDAIEKGIWGERDAVNLYNRVVNARGKEKYHFRENTKRLRNKWITGMPDTYIGPSVEKAKHGFDVKCSKSISSFPRHERELDPSYLFQDHSYMDLTGAETWTTVYCLVNTPHHQILKAQESVYYKMGCPGEGDRNFDRYVEKLIDIEKNNIFDISLFKKENPNVDLHCNDWDHLKPIEDRIVEFVVHRDEAIIQKIHERVEMIREYMNSHFS